MSALPTPLCAGFGLSLSTPARAVAGNSEPSTMGKISSNAEIILEAIKDNGGAATGAQLRELLPDMSNGDRGAAMSWLKTKGKIKSHGATSQIQYLLSAKSGRPDREPQPQPPAPEPSSRPAPTDSFERSEQIAEDRIAGRDDSGRARMPQIAWPAQIYLSVPIIEGATDEVQLIAALDFVVSHFASKLNAELPEPAIARAANWLASKHQVAP